MSGLSYVAFISSIDHTFWTNLNAKKLDELKLDSRPLPITASFTNDCAPGVPAHISLTYDSFMDGVGAGAAAFYRGQILNTNTVEEFKGMDYTALLNEKGAQVWEVIKSGAAFSDPSLLNVVHSVCFADLKKYKYNYWFAFPALVTTPVLVSQRTVGEEFTEEQKEKVRHIKGAAFLSADLLPVNDGDVDSMEFIVFSDPSTDAVHPGWPLRNLIALLSHHIKSEKTVKVVCLREKKTSGNRSIDHSLLLALTLQPLPDMPKVVGWERNGKGKLAPKFVDLSATMDPAKISESSVNLNLKLMRWRLLPELDLEILQKLKVLVLGSGTLGCNVARCLLGWGVKKITMLDNGKVSYSNPVRQSLFNFEDCGKDKATIAAERIRLINPSAEVEGVTLSIPMPGHPVSKLEEERVTADIERLEGMVESADVVFLLTDTRESRWLPTLLTAAKQKLCINSALGFDTYLVMRHGVKSVGGEVNEPAVGAPTVAGLDLGCYFCNDVVAPSDSTKDRTLDQMCTVTRPGNALVAGSLAVELMVSVLQHPQKGRAPATLDPNNSSEDSCLGRIPHQIRGFLAHFTSVQTASHAFDKCTACCTEVIHRYRADKMGFLMEVFNTPNYLEKVSGLAEMIDNTNFGDIWEFDSDTE